MKIGPFFNASLLEVIARMKETTIDELKKEYLPPEQKGVIQGVTVMFDSDLQTLCDMGLVSVEGDIVKFLRRQ